MRKLGEEWAKVTTQCGQSCGSPSGRPGWTLLPPRRPGIVSLWRLPEATWVGMVTGGTGVG